MSNPVTVNTEGVRQMARDLAKSSGKPYGFVLRMETASMVKIAALRHKVASLAKIQRKVTQQKTNYLREPGGSAVVITDWRRFAGRTWFSYRSNTTGGASGSKRRGIRGVGAFMVFDQGFPSRGWHLPDSVWSDYQAAAGYRPELIRARTAELTKRRGLLRLSWLQMADGLRVDLDSVSPAGNLQQAVARGARGPGGRTYANGTAQEIATATALAYRIVNSSPLAIAQDGQRILDGAINQRVKGFQIAMAKGVLTDLKTRATRWRGIFVKAA